MYQKKKTYELKHSNELYHHGVKGQKWGIRRYQNLDGTLTAEGKAHYSAMYNKDGTIKPERILNKHSLKPEDKKRRNAAARLGLVASNVNSWIDDPEEFFENYDNYAEWFTFEDQTIGYSEAADLVLQGYSKKDILNTMENIKTPYDGKYGELSIAYPDEIGRMVDQYEKVLKDNKDFDPNKKISDQKDIVKRIIWRK